MPALLIGVGFVALLVQSFFSFPREQAPVWILLGVALGLVGGQNGQGGGVTSRWEKRGRGAVSGRRAAFPPKYSAPRGGV